MAEPTGPLNKSIATDLQRLLSGPPTDARLDQAMRLLGKWKAHGLALRLRTEDGDVIPFGPFAGMDYNCRASEGGEAPRRLGCYEASLAPIFETIIQRAYPTVVDVGCAEGYYATGLALRMPNTQVLAFDSNPTARERCAKLARSNGVEARIAINGTVDHAGLSAVAGNGAMILCDIEGAEASLLDPDRAPGLRFADILVEVHDGMVPGLCATLTNRFTKTHNITRIDRAITDAALPAWAHDLPDMDRLIMLWEWRSGPTPWLWMQSRDRSKHP